MILQGTAFALFMLFTSTAFAQQGDTIVLKGSYLHYGQPAIEDNAMLLEEAFNQESGKHQFIFNGFKYKEGASYAFTHEVPLGSHAHQLSYTVPVTSIFSESNSRVVGVDDLVVTYRPLLMDKYDWALLIPGVSLIVPTGDISKGIGSGGWGIAGAVAMTKRISSRVTTHYNLNGSLVPTARMDLLLDENDRARLRHQYRSAVLGMSMVWHWKPHFNFILENHCFFSSRVKSGAVLEKKSIYTLNPGFRFALHHKKTQVVPAVGVPLIFEGGALDQAGVFIYLSIETSRY